jgi:hypothetical protein
MCSTLESKLLRTKKVKIRFIATTVLANSRMLLQLVNMMAMIVQLLLEMNWWQKISNDRNKMILIAHREMHASSTP